VQNLLEAYAFKHDMVFSTRVYKNIEKEKYPGAYSHYGLQFLSRKIILNKEEADIAQKNGNNLHKIEFLFNDCTLCVWSVWHDNCSEKKGLYSMVLENLFNKQVKLKAKFALLCKEKEHFEKLISTVEEKRKIVLDTLKLKYASLCFDYNCLNFKQFALKVYINTFYSEAENSKSSFFLCELAEGITSAEQYNINLIADYITKKKAYWTEMVKITIKVIDNFCNKVNAFLKIKNGTSYLKIAYKEVLFSVCFISKKKYFRVVHEEIINFKSKKLFTKGIDTVKQAQMKGKSLSISDPDECFSYVVVKGNSLYDENGKKQLQRVADYIEFSDIAKELNTEIDINHYLEQTVRLFVCFINDYKRYQPPSSYKIMQLKDSDEKEKQIDAYSQKEAKKWLMKYIKALN
ncbi:2322_t:CDS:2, partial [Cetraspora pellucida]